MALINCPVCGHSVSDKATRCPNCGDPLTPIDGGGKTFTSDSQTVQTPPTPAPPDKRNSKSSNGGTIAIVVVLALVVIAVIAYFAIIGGKSGNDYDRNAADTTVVAECETVCTEDDLESVIQIANNDMPQIVEEGMRIDEILLEGDYVTYVCTIDEGLYSISDIRASHSEIKEAMLDFLKNDEESQSFLSICKSHNKGIAYRYEGDETGKTHTIYIRPSEF